VVSGPPCGLQPQPQGFSRPPPCSGSFTAADLNGLTAEEFRSLLRFDVQNNL
jgi:hypothetical protein